MKIPGRVWIAIHRAQNRWHDLLAVLAGYCNHCPVPTGLPEGQAGYSFWRCALRRRHGGLHRYRNYVWDAQRRGEYAPVEPPPSQPWDRNSTPTMRQARNMHRWQAEQSAKRRARLRKGGLL